jgi:hypothetical protein
MRSPRAAWTVASVFAACLIAAQSATAQQPADTLIKHVPGDNDVLIHSAGDIPPSLRDALKQSRSCRVAEDRILRELPVITFQPAPNSHSMSIVPCDGIIVHSMALLFEHGNTSLPSVMQFPVTVPIRRLTQNPGLLTWNAKAKELIGYRFSDLMPTPVYRHIYRHLGGNDLNGFVLVRTEQGEYSASGGKNWQAVREAQPGDAAPR